MTPLNKRITSTKMEKAQTMVEFAIVFPLVLLITYALIESGRWLFIYTSAVNAARDGARYGAAAGKNSGGIPYYKDCTGISNAARRGAILAPIDNINISYDQGPGVPFPYPVTCPPSGPNGFDPIALGSRIKVNVSVSYQPIINFLGIFKAATYTFSNARTILVNIRIMGTPPTPLPSRTPNPTSTPTQTPTPTPTSTPRPHP